MSGLFASHPMLMTLAVALGGALGALTRFATTQMITAHLGSDAVPLATLLVNIIGCALAGAIFGLGMAGVISLTGVLRGFLLVGFLGALTTFSAFALDTITLAEKGAGGTAIIYGAGSVLLSLAAFLAAAKMIRILIGG